MDYHGLDQEDRRNIILENVQKLEGLLRSYYIDRVHKYHQEAFNANPAPYRFYYEKDCSILVLIYPEEYDSQTAARLFLLCTPGKRKIESYVVKKEDLHSIDNYFFDFEFVENKLLPIYGYNKLDVFYTEENLIKSIRDTNQGGFVNPSYDLKYVNAFEQATLRKEITYQIRQDIQNYKKNNQTEMSYFSKDVAKFPFSLMDLQPLLDAVNDDDFSYQLDQAMAAYHQNLFLPCAATLGVCLETVCLKICEKYKLKIRGGDTQLGVLKDRLSSEKLISSRDNGRLEVAYRMRNLVAHTSPGETLREDCHFMLTVMNEIAHQHLQPEAS